MFLDSAVVDYVVFKASFMFPKIIEKLYCVSRLHNLPFWCKYHVYTPCNLRDMSVV